MVALAIALDHQGRQQFEGVNCSNETLGKELEELVAGVCSIETGEPFAAGEDVAALPVFSMPGQRVNFSLTVLISRSSPAFTTYPIVEERIRHAALHYFDSKGVDFSFTSKIVIIDRHT
jgi:hypothetical protein